MTTTYFVASMQPAITVEGENGKLSAEAELKQFQLQQLPPRVTLGFAPSRARWGPLRGTQSGRAMNAAERLRTGREGDCHLQLSHTPKSIRASHPGREGNPWLGSVFSSEVTENRFSPPLSIHCLREGSPTSTQVWLGLRRIEADKAPRKTLVFQVHQDGPIPSGRD